MLIASEALTVVWFIFSSIEKVCCLIFFLDLISFQFVVSDSGDYTIHAMDPDVLVEWDLIEQVVSFFLHYMLHIIQLVST